MSVLYFLLFLHEINFEVTFISLNMAGNYTIYSINREKILTEIFSEYDGKIPPNYDNGKVFKSRFIGTDTRMSSPYLNIILTNVSFVT